MRGDEIVVQVLPYMGGLATAGGAFGSWYLRFRQENTRRQKYKLDHSQEALEQNVQLQTAELEYIAKARQELADWFEKRLTASEQELSWARQTNTKLTEQLEVFQHHVAHLEAEGKSRQETNERIVQQLQLQVKELEAKPQQLAGELEQLRLLRDRLQDELTFWRQRLKEQEIKARRYEANSQSVIRHLHEKIGQLRDCASGSASPPQKP